MLREEIIQSIEDNRKSIFKDENAKVFVTNRIKYDSDIIVFAIGLRVTTSNKEYGKVIAFTPEDYNDVNINKTINYFSNATPEDLELILEGVPYVPFGFKSGELERGKYV